MATQLLDNASMEVQLPPTDINQDDVVSIDLPAPQGWTKKFIPKKSGTPRRNEIVFIAPTGEEIKSKRQLDQYLKSHPGGPSASEFDWGTGDTPRRSTRLSSKPKATETPESGSSKKRQKRSNSKKEEKKEDTDREGGTAEDEAPADKTEADKDVEMNDAEVSGNQPEEKTTAEAQIDPNPVKASVDNAEGKSNETEQQEATQIKDAEVAGNQPEEKMTEEAQIDANPGKASVDNAEEKADESKQQEAGSNVVGFSEDKETEVEEKRPEVELEVQVPHETAPGIGEGKLDGIAIPSEAKLSENDNAVDMQATENQEQPTGSQEEPSKELPVAQVQPEAALANTVQSVDRTSAANAGMGIDSSEQEQKDPEKISSGEVEPDGSVNTKENQDAVNHADNKPVDAGNGAHEPSAAPPITC